MSSMDLSDDYKLVMQLYQNSTLLNKQIDSLNLSNKIKQGIKYCLSSGKRISNSILLHPIKQTEFIKNLSEFKDFSFRFSLYVQPNHYIIYDSDYLDSIVVNV